jgi:hypothetical protein
MCKNKEWVKPHNFLRHYLHPLYLYCRLRDCGVKKSIACRLLKLYENRAWKHIEHLINLIPNGEDEY